MYIYRIMVLGNFKNQISALGIPSKAIWFYSPIGILIGANAILFVRIAKKIRALEKDKRDVGIQDGSTDMDRLF